MHDIGKICISEQILNKPEKLTKKEFEIIKQHTVSGAKILKDSLQFMDSDLLRIAHDICRWHHERYDGKGYPDGLKGAEIPIEAQVVALADVYDALVSKRVYKPAFSHEKAIEMIQNGECGMFSPLLIQCLLEIRNQLSTVFVCSSKTLNSLEMRNIAAELMTHNELKASSHTITMLEQERIRRHFLISFVHEIVFEYDTATDLLEFSPWGAETLGVSQLVLHPFQDSKLKLLGEDFFRIIKEEFENAVPNKPIKNKNCHLMLQGKSCLFSAVLCPLWDNREQTRFSCLIGRLEKKE